MSGAAAPVEALRAKAAVSADGITWAEVAGALLRHPRIGEKATGGDLADAAMSATERFGVAESDAAEMAAGNLAYERRFGYIFSDLRVRTVRGADARRTSRAAHPR